jgi:hypothetical protein
MMAAKKREMVRLVASCWWISLLTGTSSRMVLPRSTIDIPQHHHDNDTESSGRDIAVRVEHFEHRLPRRVKQQPRDQDQHAADQAINGLEPGMEAGAAG